MAGPSVLNDPKVLNDPIVLLTFTFCPRVSIYSEPATLLLP